MTSNLPLMLITGGSRGIGAATAILASQRGYAVTLTYQSRRQEAESVVASIRASGGRAEAVQVDVSNEADVLELFRMIDGSGGRLAVLVNNAGILAPQMRFEQMEVARIRQVFDVNVMGSMLSAREAVRRMSTRQGGQGGAIVNLSSAAARLGAPNEYIDYAASKGAIESFTVGLAKEVAAEGIRVNAVRPGVIYTDIHASGGEPDRVERVKSAVPMLRGGQPEEVAAAILWLASDDASYTTGAILDVTGGR